jgi:septal ring factor EnvC (AmiA/AmiB activator)
MPREPRKIHRPVRKPRFTDRATSKVPRWFPVAIVLCLFTLLCLTINYRALADLSRESKENETLNSQIKEAMIENVSLQEEIHYLRNDASTIEKQVKKFGLVPEPNRTEEMISKPAK